MCIGIDPSIQYTLRAQMCFDHSIVACSQLLKKNRFSLLIVFFLLLLKMTNITNYFKIVKTVNIVEEDSENISVATEFYRNQLHTTCDKNSCIELKTMLRSKIDEIEEKCLKRKKQIEICQNIIGEKKIEVARLQKTLEISQPIEISQQKLNPTHTTPRTQILIFSSFLCNLSEEQLADIRLVGPSKAEDSTFVLTSLRNLYQGRLEILQKKTITGRSKKGETKEMLTPINVDIIKRLFRERMMNVVTEEEERVVREKKVNKYIKDAQANITKSIKSSVARNLLHEYE